jgi:hypothetical protein
MVIVGLLIITLGRALDRIPVQLKAQAWSIIYPQSALNGGDIG